MLNNPFQGQSFSEVILFTGQWVAVLFAIHGISRMMFGAYRGSIGLASEYIDVWIDGWKKYFFPGAKRFAFALLGYITFRVVLEVIFLFLGQR